MELSELAKIAYFQPMQGFAFCVIALIIGYVLVALKRLGIIKSTLVPSLFGYRYFGGEIPILIGIAFGAKALAFYGVLYAALYAVVGLLGTVLVYLLTRCSE